MVMAFHRDLTNRQHLLFERKGNYEATSLIDTRDFRA